MKFKVICNEPKYLEEALSRYNKVFQTDFVLIGWEDDEVGFAEIEVENYSPADLFGLGYAFGGKEEKLRAKGIIDW